MVRAFRKDQFDILRCSRCGLGRTSGLEGFDAAEFYSEAYFQGGRSDSYADYVASEPILRAEFRRTVDFVLSLGGRRGRLLEFGCAYGFLLQEATPHFENVHGIDISEDAVAFCRQRGLDAVAGAVDDKTLRGPYDAVIGLDVIEHLPEPQETLRQVGLHMAQGAFLVLTTGDWGSLLARITGRQWRLMTPPQHLSFFTKESMRQMLQATGFEMVSCSHPWKSVPTSLIAYQLQRLAGVRPRNVRMLENVAVPVNLWDAMRVVAVKR